MNLFRIFGDSIHLFSFVYLLFNIWFQKSCAGISGKTQILLTLVYSTRYLDLFTTYISAYNSDFKIMYLCFSYATVISIYLKFRMTYERSVDTFRAECLALAALVLSLVVNYKLEFLEVAWTFSLYLEAVAAWPQFYIICNSRKVATTVFWYLLALGSYRICYILNWIYRYITQDYIDLISSASGCVQVIPYLIFWGCCACGVVAIGENKWFIRNLQNQNEIFTIKVEDKPNKKSEDELLLSAEEIAKSEPVQASEANINIL